LIESGKGIKTMNAPVSADTPALGAKALAELAEQLTQLLRLRTFPIGMKLFENLDEMAAIPGLRRPTKGKHFPPVSWSPRRASPASRSASPRKTCRRFRRVPA
jgi:hypothetical protein